MEEDENIREKGEVDSTCETQGIGQLVLVCMNRLCVHSLGGKSLLKESLEDRDHRVLTCSVTPSYSYKSLFGLELLW